jgi:Bacterial protein of unknown function (DUF922)
MKKIFYLLLLSFLWQSNSFSQNIVIAGVQGERALTWNDFTGKPEKESPHDANTYWNIDYSFKGVNFIGDTAVFSGLNIKLELNAKLSWVKKEKETDALLKHEQGHFDIGRLCVRALQQAYTTNVFLRKDLQAKLNSTFSEIMKTYHEMGIQYDKETDHSKNKEAQKRWEDLLAEKLAVK